MNIGDQVELLVEVKVRFNDGTVGHLPVGTIGTLEERDDDNMFYFVTENARTHVANHEVKRKPENH